MLSGFADQAQEKVAQTAQTALLGLGAALMLAIGLGFLTAALWIFMATATSTLMAATTIGVAYTGVGLITFAVLSGQNRARKRNKARLAASSKEKQSVQNIVHEIILAFITGLRAGQQSRHG